MSVGLDCEESGISTQKTIKPKVHFTYSEKPNYSELCQGDVIKITDEIAEVLKSYHSYFLNDQYKYFLVLTQSCDLVRRNGKPCKSPYITLAAVRDFNDYVKKSIADMYFVEKVNDILLVETGNVKKCYEIIERLYNNTEPEYFFLFHDDVFEFYNNMVAYLKVSIPLKSEHYEKCLNAKVLELSDEFKAKLGWLVGNMYSRVGTHDWGDVIKQQQDREAMILEEVSKNFLIGSRAHIKGVKKELTSGSISKKEEAMKYIEDMKVETNYDKAIKIVENCVNNFGGIHKDDRQKLIEQIKSKKTLEALIK